MADVDQQTSVDIADFVTPRAVVAQLRAPTMTGIADKRIYDALAERERLGTTGIGNGVAIPHCRLAELTRLYGLFARLERPIPYEAIDDEPVDLLFLLLAPADAGAEHLKALARVSRLLRDRAMCEKLRGANSADALYALLTGGSAG